MSIELSNQQVQEVVTQRVWRFETFRGTTESNRLVGHLERRVTNDGTLIGELREDIAADAGAAVGDPTDPGNYPNADGGMPRDVTMSLQDVMALPDTFDVGAHSGLTSTEVLQLTEALFDAIAAARIEERKQAAINAAVAAAS